MQKELEDAARDTRPISPDRSSLKEGVAGLPTTVPTKVSVTFVRWFVLKILIIYALLLSWGF